MTRNTEPRSRIAWQVLLLFLVASGLLLRFAHLGRKAATHDEVFTGLRVSGHSEGDLVRDLSSPARLVRIGDLRTRYQTPDPQRTVGDMIRGLAAEEPQFPPLYFVLIRAWARIWGGTMAVLRSWSAFCSLLALPCLYWLTLELFQSRRTAAVAAVLLTFSPFFLLHSQNARHYPMWALTILLASAALLRALRTGTSGAWILYAASLALSLYTCLFSVLIAAGHAAYVGMMEKGRLTRKSVSALSALLAAGISFLPWAWVIHSNFAQLRKVTGGADSAPLGLSVLSRGWLRVPGALLYPLNPQRDSARGERYLQYGVTAGSLLLVGFALYSLCRRSDKRVWAFILLLIGCNAAGLALQDLLMGGQSGAGGTSNVVKYLTPCFLGILLALAQLFSDRAWEGPTGDWKAAGWRAALIVFGLSQGITSLALWHAERWSLHEGDGGPATYAATAFINRSEDSALVTEASGWDVLYLSQTMNPDVRLWTRPSCFSCGLAEDATPLRPDPGESFDSVRSIFLFPNPAPSLVAWAKEQRAFDLQHPPLVPHGPSDWIWLKRR